VFIEDDAGRRLVAVRLPEDIESVRRFHELVAAHLLEPGEVLVATETDRGLFVTALVAAGYEVIAVNPLSTSRYRERLSTLGAKSDPGDARVLAELAGVDGHNHRRIAGDSDLADADKVLARAHQTMIWTRTRHTDQMRSTLREFYPAAVVAVRDLTPRRGSRTRDRSANACDDACRRDHHCSISRSAALNMIAAVGRPLRAVASH
jgi:hypothetical protein